MGHTQGKWEVADWKYEICGENRAKIMIQTKEHAIAEAVESYQENATLEQQKEQARANARRICHTHNTYDELLEACENLFNMARPSFSSKDLETGKGGNLIGYSIKPVYINELKQAIAKAKNV